MAANHREYRFFPGSIEYYIGKVRNVPAAGLKFGISGEQPIPNGLLFFLRHGACLASWGESIKLALVAQGDQTGVDILSECSLGTQVVDWGKNRENVIALFNYLTQGNPYLGQGYAPPQQSFPQPQQGGAPAPQAAAVGSVTCPNCGNSVEGNAAFCTVCGMRLR